MDQQRTDAGAFPLTPWTQVTQARGDDTRAKASMELLCKLYWVPLYAYTRRQGLSPEEAEDATQGFFVQLLDGDTLSRVDREKGRLRSYLLGALKNYLHNCRRSEATEKRGGRLQRVDFDTREVEAVCLQGREDGLTPEAFFERRWAATLLDHAMRELETEHRRTGKAPAFTVLSEFLTLHGKEAKHDEAAEKLGITEGAARVAVHRLRKRYRELVRLQVAATVATEEEVDDELRHLLSLY